MEEQTPSKEYLKAYNQADMICTYMPHLLKGMTIPDQEPSEYTRGFQDRVDQYELEQRAMEKFSPERPLQQDLDYKDKDNPKSKDIDK